MNHYNLLLIINQKYLDLAIISIRSLLKNVDSKKINKIFIGNIGLEKQSIDYLKTLSHKISIIETGKFIKGSKNAHTNEWIEAVSQKTKILKELISDEINIPLIINDIDTFVVSDFSHLIDNSKDIQVCKRIKPSLRPDMVMNYIGSFMIINSSNAIDFLNSWINRMQERIDEKTLPPYETPSLCDTIEKFKDQLKIGELNEIEISNPNNYEIGKTHIIHMKSEYSIEHTNIVYGRVRWVKNFKHFHIIKYSKNKSILLYYLYFKQKEKIDNNYKNNIIYISMRYFYKKLVMIKNNSWLV